MSARFVWTDAVVREALRLPGAEEGLAFAGISTDTRTVGPGELFVALAGERFDGHAFLGEAAARGAKGAVVSQPVDPDLPLALYHVEDTLVALGDLARSRRRALPARVLAITGSSGKTTVKDLLSAALAGSFRIHATKGNLNNRVGVPLTLLSAPEDAEVLVVEMGTSEPGEIRTLAAIGEPDASVVTTVAEAHLTGLGSVEGVLEEKLDLTRGTRVGGTAVVGDEPPALPARAREIRPGVVVAGLSDRADPDARGEIVGSDRGGRFAVRLRGREVRPSIPGRHGAYNLVLALTAARLLGADEETAARDACAVAPRAMRGEVRTVGALTLLVDCYNANPQSVRGALDLLAELPGEGRVAILGSMLELGEHSGALHREALDHARALPLDLIVAVGEFARAAGEVAAGPAGAPEVISAPTPEEGYEALRPRLAGGETVLLKASRGVALERLLPRFEEDFG